MFEVGQLVACVRDIVGDNGPFRGVSLPPRKNAIYTVAWCGETDGGDGMPGVDLVEAPHPRAPGGGGDAGDWWVYGGENFRPIRDFPEQLEQFRQLADKPLVDA